MKSLFCDNINVMTSEGVISGDLIFEIEDNKLKCGYDFAEPLEFYEVEVENPDDEVSYDNLIKKIDNWYVNGEKPRDEDDNVIPFRY